MAWNDRNVVDFNFMKHSNDSSRADLLTFMPFTKENCNNSNEILLVNQFAQNKWISDEIYPKKLENFHNCSLRLGLCPAAPASSKKEHPNGTVEYYGSDVLITEELAKRFNFQNKAFFYDTWGDTFENGTGNFMCGGLLEGHLDYIIGWNFLAYKKGVRLDFVQPYFFVPFVIVVPPGMPYSSLENLIRSFSHKLWMAFIGCTIFTVAVIKIHEVLSKKFSQAFATSIENFDYYKVLVIIVGDGSSVNAAKNFLRMVVMSFVILCFILRTAYVSEMFNNMQSGGCKKIVESLEEMEERKFVLHVPSYVEIYIAMKELHKLYDHKLIKVMDEKLEDDYFIYNMSNPYLEAAVAEPYDDVMRVSAKGFFVNVLSDPLNTFPIVIYTQKNSFLTKIFNDKIQNMLAAGLIEYWILQQGHLGNHKSAETREPKVMSIGDLSAPFYICICGLLISTACFVCEILLKRCKSRNLKNQIYID